MIALAAFVVACSGVLVLVAGYWLMEKHPPRRNVKEDHLPPLGDAEREQLRGQQNVYRSS